VFHLIALIGLTCQTVAAVLLLALFGFLGKAGRHRGEHFRVWGRGWASLAIALTLLLVRELFAPGLAVAATTQNVFVRLAEMGYQFGKLGFLGYLLSGTLVYSRGMQVRRATTLGLTGAMAYAMVTSVLGASLADLVILQAPAYVATALTCVYLLRHMPQKMRNMGSRSVEFFLGAQALLWGIYFVAFGGGVQPGWQIAGGWRGWLVMYDPFVDLLLEMLLGLGMIVVLMEDARRALDQAHNELLREAHRDALTRAFNRRAYNERAGLELPANAVGTAVVFDLDNLKEVNDEHGHHVGDDLLRHFVKVVCSNLRPSDRLYRWGGDEFLLVLPAARPNQVLPRIESVIAHAQPLHTSAGVRIPLEVSFGAATFDGAAALDRAVSRADAAMYDRKRQRKYSEGDLQSCPSD
jgi:diguanylate cyclase (GGDEF)-like protein